MKWPNVLVVLALASGRLAAAAAEPCVPAAGNDPAPWTRNARILGSFPPDTPKPEFAGAFGDDRSEHELHLWRDAEGVFGELLSPVLDADSPTSRLYEAHFDPKTGVMSFTVRFKDGERRFDGTLRPDSVTGTLRLATRSKNVTWGKLRADSVHGAVDDAYASRAQFECAMTLFRRY